LLIAWRGAVERAVASSANKSLSGVQRRAAGCSGLRVLDRVKDVVIVIAAAFSVPAA
jgi:hypothetical protein